MKRFFAIGVTSLLLATPSWARENAPTFVGDYVVYGTKVCDNGITQVESYVFAFSPETLTFNQTGYDAYPGHIQKTNVPNQTYSVTSDTFVQAGFTWNMQPLGGKDGVVHSATLIATYTVNDLNCAESLYLHR